MSKATSKDRKILDLSPRQLSFEFMDKDQYQVEYLGETKQGYGLWRKKEPHGGWSYWTDEVAPYILVFDEALDNPMSMFEALEHLGLGERMWQSIGASFDYTQR